MEWIKIKTNHVLLSGLSDEEIGRLVKIQALIATKEKLPNDAEISRIIRPKSLRNLEKKLESFGENLQLIAEKVLEDVVKSSKEKEKTAKRVQKFRSFSRLNNEERNALRNAENGDDVTLLDKNREEKSRVDKEKNILTDILKEKPLSASLSPEATPSQLAEFNFYSPPKEPADVVSEWNEFAAQNDLPQVVGLNRQRVAGVRNRLSEKRFDLQEIFQGILGSSHLRGQNDRGWKVTFDFVFLSANNWLKIIEGNYRDNGKINNKKKTMEEIFNELK